MFEEQDLPSIPRWREGMSAPDAPVLAVAMGASAGGLEALREFFSALNAGAGMAFVIVEHLDPTSKSLLPSILMQFTSLPVSEISEGQAMRPNHVFVAPANVIVELDGATFRLSPLTDSVQRRTPIDALFRSLARSFGPRGVGIVLSGTGADGTVGAQQIANEGGMTLAQMPEHAKYDSMPRSAIATGVIDHVLTPAQMAEELLAYVGHIEQHSAEEIAPANQEAISQALAEICEILQRATDHNFRHYKTTTLVRRIQRRMQVLRIAQAQAYVERLRAESDEVTQLFRELLIGVTSFFRDPEAFEVLFTEVLQPLVNQHRDTLRLWVPGCATGEEAYTLAILMREALEGSEKPPAVQIFATDIDERALSVARQGLYPLGIAEQVSKQRLERFFIKKGKRYQVTKELRELCLFSPHNLITAPPFSRLDLISCRNLLIYFGPHLQKKLIPLFHYALRPNGYLFLGPSESISTHKELFVPINAKHRISQRKATALSSSPMLSGTAGYRGSARIAEASADAEPDLHQLMQRILLDEFAPKAVIITEDGQILSASGEMERYLTVTEGTFQNNVIRLARPGLRVGLRAALSDAIKIRRRVVHDKVSVQVDSGVQRVRVTVQPMPRVGEEAELFMVVFQDLGPLLPREEGTEALSAAEADSLLEQLERELSSTREDLEKSIQDLEAANEELKSSNEELLSMNEELQSANEELETSKEEIQSTNEALAKTHANLSNLLTSTAIATIFLDEDLEISSFTPAVAGIYNLRPSDIGRPLADITHRCPHMPPLPAAADLQGAAEPREDEVITEDGSWYLRRSHSYRTHDGKADGMVVTFVDVTKLKEAEATARLHQQQLQLITDSLPVLISYVDDQQRYRFNNLAYERWFGVSRDSIRGQHVRDILGEAAYQTALPRIQMALQGDPVGFESELPFRDGTKRTIRAEYVPDKGSGGEVRGYFSLKYDVTDERRLAQSLAEAKRTAESANLAKSDFLANMSHEIRTPLTAILGYGELLQTHITDPDNLACIEALRRNGRHLVEIINDILDLSKIEAGMLRTELVRMSPGGALRDVVDGLRVRAAEKGLTLDLIHEGPLPATIESDPTRVRQILFNLLSNAIKFTEKGGVKVSVRLLESDHMLDVAVTDTGIGISPEQQSALFAPFTQADRTITRRYGGTGLGLTISKRLVELLGGRLSVQSEAGVGSTFRFCIPTGSLDSIAISEEHAGDSPTPILPASRLVGRRVLVVDDRRDMRYLIQTYLEEAGAEVVGASDGAMAVESTAKAIRDAAPFDAIILDMQMPVMDGYAAAPRLRELGHQGPIVALTANAMKGDQERCLAAGCSQYLSKPVDRLRLLYAVSQAGAEASLPVFDPDGGTAPAAPAPAAQPAFRPRVLLVDDNVDSLEVLSALLENSNIEVVSARSGAEALEHAASSHPHVVVLDLGLPDVDGYTVLEHLRHSDNLQATRFIALTGRNSSEEVKRMAEAGFHHQMVKPPDFNELIRIIKASASV